MITLPHDKETYIDFSDQLESVYHQYTGGSLREHISYVDKSLNHKRDGYHNIFHCLSTAWRAYTYLEHKTPDNVRTVILAGLYHDACYNPRLTEEQNIQNAISTWVARCTHDICEPGVFSDVRSLIAETSYPHASGLRTLVNQELAYAVRDADIMQITYPDRRMFFEGLHQEGVSNPSYDFLTLDMLHTQTAQQELVEYQKNILPYLDY